MDWKENILTSEAGVLDLLRGTKRIAVLGIKPETHAMQPAFYVAKYMAARGFEIVPVPVYYPKVREILGKPVFRDLNDIPGKIDMVNVFRRPADINGHVDEILRKAPRSVWFQLGIKNDAAAERFAKAGIKVVQDKCLMVEHRYL